MAGGTPSSRPEGLDGILRKLRSMQSEIDALKGTNGLESAVIETGGLTIRGDASVLAEAADGSATRLAEGALEQRAAPDLPWEPIKAEPSDGLAPDASPVPDVSGGIGTVVVRLPEVGGTTDPISVRLHAALEPGVVVDELTREGVVSNGGGALLATVGGVRLVAGDVVYVRTQAFDVDGVAEPSAEFSAIVLAVDFDEVSQAIRDAIADADDKATEAQSAAALAASGAEAAQSAADAAQAAADAAAADATGAAGDAAAAQSVADAAQAAADAAALAAGQAATDAGAALDAATTALDSVNGKNSRRTGPAIAEGSFPTTPAGTVAGDTYWGRADGVIVQQWSYDGAAWVQEKVDVAVVAGLDAAYVNALLVEADTILGRIVAAEQVTAEMVAADVMVVNQFFSRDGVHVGAAGGPGFDFDLSTGFLQRGFGGTPRVSMPMDPSQPNVMDSDLVTRGFTALGRASFRGPDIEISRNSVMTLEVGTTRPSSSLGGSSGAEWAPAGLGSLPSNLRGGFRDTDGTWLFTAPPTTTLGKPRLARLNLNGTITYTTLSSLQAATSDTRYIGHNGVVKIGSQFFVALTRNTGPADIIGARPYSIRAYRLDASLNYLDVIELQAEDSDFLAATTPHPVATDGSSLYTAGYYQPTDRQRVRRWSTAGSLQATVSFPAGTTAPSQFTVGNHDFGAFRYVLGSIPSFGSPQYRSFNSAGTAVPAEDFASSPALAQWGWDGSRFVGWTTAGSYRSDPRTTTLNLRAGYSWYDDDSAGGFHETQISPIRSITLPARAGAYRLTAPPPADDGTIDAPSVARLYVGRTDATLRLQGQFVDEIIISDPQLDTGALPPTVNTFPDGVPAVLRSKSGASAIYGDSKMISRDPLGPTEVVNQRTLEGHVATSVWTRNTNQGITTSSSFQFADPTTASAGNGTEWVKSGNTWTCARAGYYQFTASALWEPNASNRRAIIGVIDGTQQAERNDQVPNGAYPWPSQIVMTRRFAVGQQVQFRVLHTFSSTVNITEQSVAITRVGN